MEKGIAVYIKDDEKCEGRGFMPDFLTLLEQNHFSPIKKMKTVCYTRNFKTGTESYDRNDCLSFYDKDEQTNTILSPAAANLFEVTIERDKGVCEIYVVFDYCYFNTLPLEEIFNFTLKLSETFPHLQGAYLYRSDNPFEYGNLAKKHELPELPESLLFNLTWAQILTPRAYRPFFEIADLIALEQFGANVEILKDNWVKLVCFDHPFDFDEAEIQTRFISINRYLASRQNRDFTFGDYLEAKGLSTIIANDDTNGLFD